MIQRRQSIYLFLGALATGALFLFGELWSGGAAAYFGWFTPVAAILAGITAAGALVTVFLYQNRSLQKTMVAILQMQAALLTVLLFAGHYAAGALGTRTAVGALDLGKIAFFVLPVVTYVLFLLARRAIQRDIELVRSMDRLR